MKIDAVAFSEAGDKYLGKSYNEMDCQAFVEICMQDCGLKMNLAGSNAWYREVKKNGWVGSPEECVKIFGQIPKGALLFILVDNGKEPEKYKKDRIGNAQHIGIKTGRGKGAIHSSSSKACVTESEFHDKTIKNGGWNRIGLYNKFDYGKSINWILEHNGIGEDPDKKEDTRMVTVTGPGGQTVNLRKTAGGALIKRIQSGTKAEMLEGGDEWSKVRVDGTTGWMMSKYLVADDSTVPADPTVGEGVITLTISAAEAQQLLPILEKVVNQLVTAIGRG